MSDQHNSTLSPTIDTSIWDNSWFTIPYLLFLVGGIFYTLTHPFGYELIALNPFRAEPLNTFFVLVTKVGEAKIWIVLSLILVFFVREFTLMFLVGGLFMWPFSWILKRTIGFPRPSQWLDINDLDPLVVRIPGINLLGGYNSLPSGHTMLAFMMFSLVTLMLPNRYKVFGLLFIWSAVLVGISRVFLLQHFLRDILWGSVFGLLIGDFVWQLYRKGIFTKIQQQHRP
jgi:membrane-associated phospholipid phosphatase